MKYFLILFNLFFVFEHPIEEIIWSRNLEESIKVTKHTNKTIIVYFGASWCAPCKIMEKNIFSNKEFIKYSTSFEMVKIYDDFSTKEKERYNYYNQTIKKYNISSFPTIMVLKNGRNPCIISGYIKDHINLIKKINICN